MSITEQVSDDKTRSSFGTFRHIVQDKSLSHFLKSKAYILAELQNGVNIKVGKEKLEKLGNGESRRATNRSHRGSSEKKVRITGPRRR